MISKVWKDPVWSSVIATGIIALIGIVGIYFLNWWPKIKLVFVSLFSFLSATSEINNWLIGLMAICAAIVVFFIVAILWNLAFPDITYSSWKNYTSDNFLGLEWHWRYSSSNSITNLYSCCSNCHYQVYPEDESSYNTLRIFFTCDICKEKVGPFDDTGTMLNDKVKRFIQQKIRTNSWHKDQ